MQKNKSSIPQRVVWYLYKLVAGLVAVLEMSMKWVFRFLLIGVGVLGVVLTYNTYRFTSKQQVLKTQNLTPEQTNRSSAMSTGNRIDSIQAINRLSQVVKLPTVSEETRIDSAIFDSLGRYFMDAFPEVARNIPREVVRRFSYIYRWAGTNPKLSPILLTAHLDVVPVSKADLPYWKQPPFSGNIQGGFVWGRGSLDDKVSAMAILEAIESLLKEGYEPARSIYLAFGHDEEVTGYGAKAMAARFKQEKVQFEYVLDEGLAVVEKALPGLDAPVALVGVTEKGYATYKATLRLKEGGHTMMPPNETAISRMSAGLVRLSKNPFPANLNPALQELFAYTGPEMRFPYKTIFANLWLTAPIIKRVLAADPASNAMLRTTIAPSIIEGGKVENVLPTEVTAFINCRLIPGHSLDEVARYLKKTMNDPAIQISLHDSLTAAPATPVSSTQAFGFECISKTTRQLFPDAVVAPGIVIGRTDGRSYQGVAKQVYRFQPVQLSRADLKRIHGFNERISTEGYIRKIKFYRQLILNSSE